MGAFSPTSVLPNFATVGHFDVLFMSTSCTVLLITSSVNFLLCLSATRPLRSLRVACEARYCHYSKVPQISIFQITEASFSSVFFFNVFFYFLFSFFFCVSKPSNLCAIISGRNFCSVFATLSNTSITLPFLFTRVAVRVKRHNSRAEPPLITHYTGLPPSFPRGDGAF